MKTLFFVLLIVCLLGSQLQAQTTFRDGQNVSGTWTTYGSPYMVDGKIEVQRGASLSIMPGVVVKFSDKGSLLVHGSLMAQGTSSSWITFTKSGSSKWKGIAFDQTKDNNSLVYCRIEYGDYPSFASISSYGALTVKESNVEIRNCIIVENGGVGLHYINSPNQVVDHCTFAYNSNTDLYAPGTPISNPRVKNTTFWGGPRSIDNTCDAQVSNCSLVESSYPTKTKNLGNNLLGRDPLFVDGRGGNYRLSSSSPCLRAGENGSDIGAYGGSGGGSVVTNNTNVGNGRFVPQPQKH